MDLNGRLTLNSGFCFDYSNMLGDRLISEKDLGSIQHKIAKAAKGLEQIRKNGQAEGHLSKDGSFEPVYFSRLPFIADGNPNTLESIQKLKVYGQHIWDTKDVVVFFGIGGSYLGNKVLFDIHTGAYWNQEKALEGRGYPKVYFTGNNLDADHYASLLAEIVRQAQYKQFAGQGKT